LKIKTVYLPLETFTREYLGKLALGLYLVEKDCAVVIGYNHLVRSFAINSEKGNIYYETKGKSPKGMEHLGELRRKNIALVGQDEEAGISFLEFEDYARQRPEITGTNYFEQFYSWGEPDFRLAKGSTSKSNILKTGSPRSVFWGEIGRRYYIEQINHYQTLYGDFIFLVSNFGGQNRIWSPKEDKKHNSVWGYSKEIEIDQAKRLAWEAQAFKSAATLVRQILEHTKYKIVIRPHPGENPLPWVNLFSKSPRVIVSKEGDSLPHLFASKHVIHAGSTVGLESLLCQQSTISFQNLIGLSDFPMTANYYSVRPADLSHLLNLISEDKSYLAVNNFEFDIREKLTTYDDVSVLTSQSKAIGDLEFDSTIQFENARKTLKDQILSNRYYSRLRYGKSSYTQIHENKRPRMSLLKVQKDIKSLVRILELDIAVSAKELGESTFALTKV